jgi:hypothetical protein
MAEVKVNQAKRISVVVNTSRVPTAGNTTFDSSGTSLTSTNLEDAVKEIADRFFQGEDTPTEGLTEGDLWYDKNTGQLKIYIE